MYGAEERERAACAVRGEYSECLDAECCRTFWQPHTVILHKHRKSVGEDDLQAQREREGLRLASCRALTSRLQSISILV